jgi:hypothetical protein
MTEKIISKNGYDRANIKSHFGKKIFDEAIFIRKLVEIKPKKYAPESPKKNRAYGKLKNKKPNGKKIRINESFTAHKS